MSMDFEQIFKYITLFVAPFLVLHFYIYATIFLNKSQNKSQDKVLKIGILHPYCNQAGGGEKVLWCLIDSLFKQNKKLEVAIYTGDLVMPDQILKKAQDRFNINLMKYENKIKFIYVQGRKHLEPKQSFTMLLQILGTFYFSVNCIFKYQPHFLIDTTGLAFSFLMFKIYLPTCKIGAYVHYPFISTDMIQRVKSQYKNQNLSRFSLQIIKQKCKLVYYHILLFIYSQMGYLCSLVFVNSTWTHDHINKTWNNKNKWYKSQPIILYPPCNVNLLTDFKTSEKSNTIMSFAQFRPEKLHSKQLEIFQKVLEKTKDYSLKFKIVGSCRGKEDFELLENLKKECKQKQLDKYVEFIVGPAFPDLLNIFKDCSIGLHTMEYEHFGITVVEMMAGGLITIAHDSAGPKEDIIQEESKQQGFLCKNSDSYTDKILQALDIIKQGKRDLIVQNARQRAQEFSDEAFIKNSILHFKEFLQQQFSDF